MVAPLVPHAVHHAHWRSLSLEVFGPHRITATAQASGERCWHFSQWTHIHSYCKMKLIKTPPVNEQRNIVAAENVSKAPLNFTLVENVPRPPSLNFGFCHWRAILLRGRLRRHVAMLLPPRID